AYGSRAARCARRWVRVGSVGYLEWFFGGWGVLKDVWCSPERDREPAGPGFQPRQRHAVVEFLLELVPDTGSAATRDVCRAAEVRANEWGQGPVGRCRSRRDGQRNSAHRRRQKPFAHQDHTSLESSA